MTDKRWQKHIAQVADDFAFFKWISDRSSIYIRPIKKLPQKAKRNLWTLIDRKRMQRFRASPETCSNLRASSEIIITKASWSRLVTSHFHIHVAEGIGEADSIKALDRNRKGVKDNTFLTCMGDQCLKKCDGPDEKLSHYRPAYI